MMKMLAIVKLSGKIIHILLIVVTFIIYFCLNYFLLRLTLLYSDPFRPLIVIINIWCSFNSVFNYVMVTLVDPGSPSQLPPHLLQGITNKCTICLQRKPPRTHHCTFCEKCVLHMDHHCVWIGNCVGHHNRKYFINFLTYVTLQLSSLSLTLNLLGLAHQYSDVFQFALGLLGVVGSFTFFHWVIALRGKSSMEACQANPPSNYRCKLSYHMEIIFGTSNIFLALLPSPDILQHSGCEWNFR